jgi:RNA polymerase sigma factor (sigma-70 family)
VDDGDLKLISQCLSGDEGAYGRLYAAHAARVTVCFLRTGFAHADAEDLAQETFVRAFKSLRTFDPDRGRFRQWLAAIVRNVIRRAWSRRSSNDQFDPELADEMFAAPECPAAAPEAREEVEAVRQCVASLPPELAGIVRLRYIEGRTTRGIADFIGIPEATVRLRLKEAHGLLEACLKGKGFLG